MARPIAEDHDEKRAVILKTAAQVFAAEGVARASMAQVAQACGISKANIYHYYPGKDALLFEILDSYLMALRDRLADLPLDGKPPEDKLRLLIREILLAYEGMDDEHKIQTEGIAHLPTGQTEILKGYQRDMVRQMADVIREIVPETLGQNPEALRAAVMSVFGMLNWFYMWNAQAGERAREDYAEVVTSLSLGGFRNL